MTLLNTAMSRELDNIARFFRVAADYADDIGFDNQLLIKPKSKEPTKHQYDFGVAAVLAFLGKYGLENRFTFNLERNHAALAGHTFQYEIRYTRINDAPGERRRQLGRQAPRLGHRPVPDRRLHHDAREVRDLGKRRLGAGRAQPPREGPPGSLRTGRPVPRPRRRRGHLRQGLEVAHEFRSAGDLAEFREARYESYDAGVGEDITEVSITFESLRKYTLDYDNVELQSGEQERLKNLLNRYVTWT